MRPFHAVPEAFYVIYEAPEVIYDARKVSYDAHKVFYDVSKVIRSIKSNTVVVPVVSKQFVAPLDREEDKSISIEISLPFRSGARKLASLNSV